MGCLCCGEEKLEKFNRYEEITDIVDNRIGGTARRGSTHFYAVEGICQLCVSGRTADYRGARFDTGEGER